MRFCLFVCLFTFFIFFFFWGAPLRIVQKYYKSGVVGQLGAVGLRSYYQAKRVDFNQKRLLIAAGNRIHLQQGKLWWVRIVPWWAKGWRPEASLLCGTQVMWCRIDRVGQIFLWGEVCFIVCMFVCLFVCLFC